MPALPLGRAGTYVAAAYVVLLALFAIYVAIMTHRITRAERRISQLDELLRDEEP